MNKIELRELLHQEYKSENWKKITEFVFPNVSYLQKPQDIPIKNYDGLVESFKQLGNVKLIDGKNLAMFEVRVSESVNIPYNRVKLRSLVAPFIDQEHNHGVLVIYEQGKENYRFTFTAKSTEFDEEKGDFVNKETDAKRYTYVLGKNESCKTAADRFFDLAGHKNEADINAVQDAFSVEKLSKQFFKEYKEHYEKFVGYLMASASYHTAIFKTDDKAIRDFVKLLLGRLVFIQFVQKKRWMGVPPMAHGWHDGQADFLFISFRNFQHKGLFYSHFLEPLFYETLSKPNRPNNIFSVTGTKVPFLNGGLFEKEETDTSLVNFPEAYFNDLLEFFDKYNFTINEYDPIDHEVGIDPEMLGSIFENLLEDNKDKGTFYTPKEIVHYMCQESLKEYLKTYLQEKNVWIENEEFGKSLEAFVKKKEAGGVIDYDEVLATALRDVKICDPAIGSGAFPMGLLNEIYHCVFVLFSASPDVVGEIWKMDKWAPDVVKKNIIQNSIYGVDIEKGAVDIARLRFWLSLIIDEPEPHSLPNLDYKIVVGNSLVCKFDGEIVEIDWNRLQKTGEAHKYVSLIKPQVTNLASKQRDYFDPSNKNKKQLASEIRNLKIELLINQLSFNKKLYINKTVQKGGFMPLAADIKYNTERELQIHAFDKLVTKLKYLLKNPNEPFNHFDWNLDFPEVLNPYFTNDNGGFDIVIGNPPYIEFKKVPAREKANYKRYQTANRKYDIFCLFIELSSLIIKKGGVHCYINPTTFLMKDYGIMLRELIRKEFKILEIFDFADYQIFESAITYTGIFIFKRIGNSSSYDFYYQKLNNKEKANSKELLFIEKESNKYKEVSRINSEKLYNESWIFGNKDHESILVKIEDKHPRLKSLTKYIFVGIQSGKDEVFFMDKNSVEKYQIEKEVVIPILKGKDVRKYAVDWSGTYILYPYDKKTNKVIEENQFKRSFPNAYSYLVERKEILNGREYFEKSSKCWYELWCERVYSKFQEVKIVNAEISPENRFQIDYSGYLGNTKIFSTVLKKEWIKYYLTLLAILNSSLMNYYHKKIASPKAGGFYDYKTQFIQNYPIKFPDNIRPFDVLVSYVLSLNSKQLKDEFDQEMICYFEQIIDGIVYELYLPDLFKKHNLCIIKYLDELPEIIESMGDGEKMKTIKNVFFHLNEKDHSMKINLININIIPEIAITSGKTRIN